MAVSGVSNYKDAMYYWQSQQLKANGNSNSSNSAASILNQNTSMIQQVSSMIELTKYAMDAMGVGSDSRVTFNQITKYQNQLQNEFSQSVKDGLANSGISDFANLSFSIDKSGNLSVISDKTSDRKMAQAWLDANPALANSIHSALTSAGISDGVTFKISSTGKMTVVNQIQNQIQGALNEDEDLADALANLSKNLGESGLKSALPVALNFDENGDLRAEGSNADKINDWLAGNPQLAKSVADQLKKNNVEQSAATLRINSDGNLQININNADLNEAQAALDKLNDIGKSIYNGLNNLGIDPNIKFSIQINADGSFNILSDHPDSDKVRQFFEDNPELIKKYRQIETLAGIDDARKAMQISPSAMRKRIQIESMMSWWATSSDNTSSYFGNYDSNSLSLMSGLNLKV